MALPKLQALGAGELSAKYPNLNLGDLQDHVGNMGEKTQEQREQSRAPEQQNRSRGRHQEREAEPQQRDQRRDLPCKRDRHSRTRDSFSEIVVKTERKPQSAASSSTTLPIADPVKAESVAMIESEDEEKATGYASKITVMDSDESGASIFGLRSALHDLEDEDELLQNEEAAFPATVPFHYGSPTYAEGDSPSAHMALAASEETEDEGLQVLRDEAIASAASDSFWEDYSIDSDNNLRSRSRSPIRTFASYHEESDTAGQQPSEAGDHTQMCSAPCSGIVMRWDVGLHPSGSIHGPCNRLCRLRQGHRSGVFSQCDCLLGHALSEDLDDTPATIATRATSSS